MRLEDIDPPPIEPVDLDTAKTFLRVDGESEDGLIGDLIQSARIRVEDILRITLITRRRLYTTGPISGRGVFLNISPVESVETVTAITEDGTESEVPLESLEINLRCAPASLRLNSGSNWTTASQTLSALEIELTPGFGITVEDVPMPLRHAILLLVAEGYEHRLQSNATPKAHFPMMVDALLMPYRTLRL